MEVEFRDVPPQRLSHHRPEPSPEKASGGTGAQCAADESGDLLDTGPVRRLGQHLTGGCGDHRAVPPGPHLREPFLQGQPTRTFSPIRQG
jgi:hypothetical protein